MPGGRGAKDDSRQNPDKGNDIKGLASAKDGSQLGADLVSR